MLEPCVLTYATWPVAVAAHNKQDADYGADPAHERASSHGSPSTLSSRTVHGRPARRAAHEGNGALLGDERELHGPHDRAVDHAVVGGVAGGEHARTRARGR